MIIISNIVPSMDFIFKYSAIYAISDNRTDKMSYSIWKYRIKSLTLHR